MVKERKSRYRLNSEGQFIIENYNFAKPFANFFPGIAGIYGIPMWVFYVNRAQGIISFGIKDKDHSILEFFPANKAWQLVSSHGFRTFIKIYSGKKTFLYEPFQNGFLNLKFKLTNQLSLSSSDLKLEENNLSLGLKVKVEYFTIPNDSYAALVRTVTLKNTSKATKEIQTLDGLPQIVPYGVSNLFLKKLGRTIEAWMNVENLDKYVPFYKLDVEPQDKPEVIHIKEGNFYLGFHYEKGKPILVKPIVNPQYIFGPIMDFSCPYQFLTTKDFTFPKSQIIQSKTPCGFLLLNLNLQSQQEKTIYSLIGYMRNKEILNFSIDRIIAEGYLIQKKEENKKIIAALQSDINTESSSKEFNLYAKQTYLDNIIRGGYPLIFKSNHNSTIFYVYARKHGDLERDYNKFLLQPTYFSQGNGNYRDMNQNRRGDIWFNPDITDENIITFFNLLQTDGFNPLVIKGAIFSLVDVSGFKKILSDFVKENASYILSFLEKPFTPGEVIFFMEENKIKLKVSYDEFLNILLSHSTKHQEAEHGEGFWTDHWHYCLDLLESYLGVYPEKLKEIVFVKQEFSFYDNTETVKPRYEKYILKSGKVRQLHSVVADSAKREIIRKRVWAAHIVRTECGKGEIYQTSLINKLLCLVVNKLASLDPFGMGIEMEADKPNWFDALNGLPALFGSSMCETFELKRLVLFIKEALEKTKVEKIYLSEEIYNFIIALDNLIEEYFIDTPHSGRVPDYQFWDKSNLLKEEYRKNTRFGFSGNELEVSSLELTSILNNAIKKLDLGISKAYDTKDNIYYAYFINEVLDYEIIKAPFVKPLKFNQKKLPFFLEGQVHPLRLSKNINAANALYKATRASQLYDKKLKMYKVNASLSSMPQDIGRCRVFTPGWLENESIWLHMEYKYLLEILKAGLYKEFYEDFKNILIPFQKPVRYGRSILENSSFLVGSAFPDKNLHGNGFVARLSGSTAEFLSIWLVMNLGESPFFLNENNELNLKFSPILAGWLFDRKGIYSFNFLSKILVVYHNAKRKDTFGKNAANIKRIIFNDGDRNPVEIISDTIHPPYSEQIRARQIKQIDVYF